MNRTSIDSNYSRIRNSLISYFFVFSIIALTGFEYFYRAAYLIIPVIIFALFLFIKKKNTINIGLVILVISFSTLTLVQTALGFNQSIFTFILFLVSLLGYFFISKVIGLNFFNTFINSIYYVSLISLPFFFLTFYVPFLTFIADKVSIIFTPLSFNENNLLPNEISRNILIYNFKNYYFAYNRNSGPFWEPGMFAVFLNTALFFNLLKTKKAISLRNFIFVLTIITTFSTTGYIGLFFILIVYLLFISTSRFRIAYILTLIIISAYIIELDFMQNKILEQIEMANKSGSSRFGAVLIHWQIIKNYPLTGVGDGLSRFVSYYTDATSTANGISLVFAKFGIPFGMLYFSLLFVSCIKIVNYHFNQRNYFLGISFYILLLILTFSQDISVRHFYLFLITWGLFYPKRNFNYQEKGKFKEF